MKGCSSARRSWVGVVIIWVSRSKVWVLYCRGFFFFHSDNMKASAPKIKWILHTISCLVFVFVCEKMKLGPLPPCSIVFGWTDICSCLRFVETEFFQNFIMKPNKGATLKMRDSIVVPRECGFMLDLRMKKRSISFLALIVKSPTAGSFGQVDTPSS